MPQRVWQCDVGEFDTRTASTEEDAKCDDDDDDEVTTTGSWMGDRVTRS